MDGVVIRDFLPAETTTLPLPPPESGEGFVSVQVKVIDSLGAATLSQPFNVYMFQSSLDGVDSSVFDGLTQQGADDSTLLVNVKSIIGVINTDTNSSGSSKSQNLRKKCFDVLKRSAESIESQSFTTFGSLALQANGLKQVVAKPEELGAAEVSNVVDFLKDFMTTSKEQDVNGQDGTEDKFFDDVLGVCVVSLGNVLDNCNIGS